MATAPLSLSRSPPAVPVVETLPPIQRIWRAPLVPVALAVTFGIVLDRYVSVPLPVSLLMAAGALLAWVVTRKERQPGLPLLYLALAEAALGAAYHHGYREVYPPDDIGWFAPAEPQPVRLRGVLAKEPTPIPLEPPNPLVSIPRSQRTRAVLRVTALLREDDWLPVSGKVALTVADRWEGPHVGDLIEVSGQLSTPSGPANPGEFDYAGSLRDQRIRAVVRVRNTSEAITLHTEGWRSSLFGWLAVIRERGRRALSRELLGDHSGLAVALLLGDEKALTEADWEKYRRTAVIHALVVSGQHLAVLALFLMFCFRLLGLRPRLAAVLVAFLLLTYALLTGGEPPVLRSAVMVLVGCGGLLLRRGVLLPNSFALAWLTVAVLDPTDMFKLGCQLSFLSVAILYWCFTRTEYQEVDPLDRLVEETRPLWQKLLRGAGRVLALNYTITLAIWLAVAPLVATRNHLLSPVGILIGPFVVWLTSVALIAGFLLLLALLVCEFVAPLFAGVTYWSLAGCDTLVNWGDKLPGGSFNVGTIPEWWLWVFYVALLAVLTQDALRRHWRWAVSACLLWLCVGLIGGAARSAPNELRCTFLAVGHGGCVVLETPDGRTLLYDAGSIAGPEVAERQILPFLWHRGIRRIDEVFLSHADLDHSNGLPALLDRFAVGLVSCTPTFADKDQPGVQHTLAVLERHAIPRRILRAGDRLTAGGVEVDVLHPPAAGPEGNENARSLVLLVRHAGHAMLLTGDLEGAGLARVLGLRPEPVDVLMAPHHGSRTGYRPELTAWAQPRLVISCEGPPRWPRRGPEPYTEGGAVFLGTWPHGAITVRSSAAGLFVETFSTQLHCLVPPR
jgi:competence protein ComEC